MAQRIEQRMQAVYVNICDGCNRDEDKVPERRLQKLTDRWEVEGSHGRGTREYERNYLFCDDCVSKIVAAHGDKQHKGALDVTTGS